VPGSEGRRRDDRRDPSRNRQGSREPVRGRRGGHRSRRGQEAVIAIGGGYGTLSEIALALKAGKRVVGLETWDVEGVEVADSPAAAVEAVLTDLTT
jgi:SLOG-like protein